MDSYVIRVSLCRKSSVLRWVCLLWLAAWPLTFTSQAQVPAAFSDVAITDPYAYDVYFMKLWGITLGCGTNTYCPTYAITRKEIAVFLIRSSDYLRYGSIYTYPSCTTPPFDDVAMDGYCPFIRELKNRAITGGCSPTSFCPNDNVTNAQAAALAVRARSWGEFGAVYAPTNYPPTPYYQDVTSSHWGFAYVQTLRSRLGSFYFEPATCMSRPTNFCPDTPPITRGWVAMYIIRGVIINGPYPTGEYVSFPSPRRSGTSAPAGLAEHAPDLKAGTGAGF